jgi:hypothetical protein
MISSDRIVVAGNTPEICVYDIPSETELAATHGISCSVLPLDPVWTWIEENYPSLNSPFSKCSPLSYSNASGLPICYIGHHEMGIHLLHLSASGIPVREHCYYTFPVDSTFPCRMGHSRGLSVIMGEDNRSLRIKTLSLDDPTAVGSIEIMLEEDFWLKRPIPTFDDETGRVLLLAHNSSRASVCLVLDIL